MSTFGIDYNEKSTVEIVLLARDRRNDDAKGGWRSDWRRRMNAEGSCKKILNKSKEDGAVIVASIIVGNCFVGYRNNNQGPMTIGVFNRQGKLFKVADVDGLKEAVR